MHKTKIVNLSKLFYFVISILIPVVRGTDSVLISK